MGTKLIPLPEEEGEVLERPKTKKPRRYAVLMHNDDFTTQEFVVEAITKYFSKPYEEAMQLMIMVHQKGSAKVGVYSKDIAETKVQSVMSYAQEHGMPLLLTAEPI